VRRLLGVIAALLTVAACHTAPPDEGPAVAEFSVYLRMDATEQQRADVRTRLAAVPGVQRVDFEDSVTAYERLKDLWADDPESMPDVSPSSLPGSFIVRMTDLAAIRRLRDAGAATDLQDLPGVEDVIFPCTTDAECRAQFEP
jgi:cell division transport system permease protein